MALEQAHLDVVCVGVLREPDRARPEDLENLMPASRSPVHSCIGKKPLLVLQYTCMSETDRPLRGLP